MTHIFSKRLMALAPLVLAACVETPSATDGFVRITDAQTFRATAVDRNLSNVNDPQTRFFRLNSDGSMSGNGGRGPLAGSWTFEGGFWCRTWTAGLRDSSLNAPDCQLVEAGPGTVRLTRDRGRGDAGVYAIR